MDDLHKEIPRGQYISAIEDLYARGSITKSQKDDILSKIPQRLNLFVLVDILTIASITSAASAWGKLLAKRGNTVQHNETVDRELSSITDMDKFHKEIPPGRYISAIEDLYDTRSITESQKEEILSQIPQRYPIYHFLKTLFHGSSWYLHVKRGNTVQHNETVDRELSSITDWPLAERCSQDYPDKIELNLCKREIRSEMMIEKYKRSCLKSDGQIYKMSAKERGYVLVINNKYFDNPTLNTRHGTEVDAKAIEVLFTKLNFKVEIHTDLTHQAMKEVLRKFSKMDHSKFDCFICFILSHGEEESIFCVDGKKFPLKHIFDRFNGDNCPSLLKKPKVFFIQACKNVPTSNETTDARAAADHHKNADFYKFFSTTLGEVSYRCEDYGSWFIYTWIYTIEKWAYKCNLMDLQRRVNNLMQKFKSKKLQTAEFRSSSGKEFYFFPGLHEPASRKATLQEQGRR